MKLFALLVLAVATVGAFKYDGYHLIEISPLNDLEKVQLVTSLADNDERLKQVILMNEYVSASHPIDLAVSPQSFQVLTEFLDSNGISYEILIEDLQKSFDQTIANNELVKGMWRNAATKAAPTAYLRHAEQLDWIKKAVAASSIATTFSVGKSYQGRDMLGVAINPTKTNLPTIWIDANIHAREWITSATALYVIDQLLTGTSADAVRLRTNYRWYILPNANPDGYEYTWTGDRMWRKTRTPNSGSSCVGTDPNRNWGEGWGGPGASANPCGDDYRGPKAFSEIENVNVRNFLQTIASRTNVYLSIHAFSNLWLLPWSGKSTKPADYNELKRVGDLAAAAIKKVNGLSFKVGTPPDLLYVASGGSFDYVKAQLGITYAYSPELRPASQLQGGFNIPASNIKPSGDETFAAIVAIVTNAKHK